jgi:hypothetical protein
MATVINNPNTDTSSSAGWSVAIIILAIIVLGLLAFFAFGRGGLSGGNSAGTPQVTIPVNVGGGSGGGSGTSGQ